MTSTPPGVGALNGLTVLDLSWGISGPAATMLLADNGATVTRIERPEPDPFDGYLDYRTYNRGKRSAILDLRTDEDRERFLALARTADVVVQSYASGVAERLGVDWDTLHALNPRLILCAITGYGAGSPDADRPAFDQLVAARTGYQWENRTWPGTPEQAADGEEMIDADDIPEAMRWYLERTGPVFTATPSPSIAAAYLAALGISGALRARERTGRGQRVDTSLLQGILAYQVAGWQRTENQPTAPPSGMEFSSSITLMCNAVIFPTADGWVNMWGGNTEWAVAAAEGEQLTQPDPEDLAERMKAAMANGGGPRGGLESRLRTALAAAPSFAKFPTAEWEALGHEASSALQPVRSPEDALTDPALLEEGCVAKVQDPDLGELHQPGLLYTLFGTPGKVGASVPRRGEHTDEVRAEADAAAPPAPAPASGGEATPPLAGVRVLDFGVAVAGPWGGELLAQLGAEVIKIDPERQRFWLSNAMAMGVNRSKKHVLADIKHPEGQAVVHELVKRSDVVMMNIRPQAAQKLGLDYESLRAVNPRIVHCITRGNDRARAHLPSNDQQGNALGGTEWEDGGVHAGGKPYWHCGSGGDLGDGSLGAIAIVQALYHRDRTGEGQAIDTSILNASLFSNGRIYSDASGTRYDRPSNDAQMLGLSALYRLYECSEGWLCLAAFGDQAWEGLTRVLPGLAEDQRFASAESRHQHDDALRDVLASELLANSAQKWFAQLDDAGVPCEVAVVKSRDEVFDDPYLLESGFVVQRDGHPAHGRIDMFGRLIDFSDTQTTVAGPPPVAGQHTREVLADVLGYDRERIDALIEAGALADS